MKVSHTHVTAPTQFVEAKGIRLAYRQFGKQSGVPSVLMQHFRGGLERGDPVVTDVLRDSYRRANPVRIAFGYDFREGQGVQSMSGSYSSALLNATSSGFARKRHVTSTVRRSTRKPRPMLMKRRHLPARCDM